MSGPTRATQRTRASLAGVLAGCVLGLLAGAGPAVAEPVPPAPAPPTLPDHPSPGPVPVPVPGRTGPPAPMGPAGPAGSPGPAGPAGPAGVADAGDAGDGAAVVDQFVGPLPGGPGLYPLSRYDIGYSTAGFLGAADPSVTVPGLFTNALFIAASWLIGAGIWLLTWALEFGVARALLTPVAHVAQVWQAGVVDRLGLLPTFLFLAAAFCGWQWMGRHRAGRAVGELAVSLLIAAGLAGLLAAPGPLLLGDGGLLGRTRDLSLSVAAVTLADPGQAPPAADTAAGQRAVVAAVGGGLQHAFVSMPHQVLSWGQVLDDPERPSRCLPAYRENLAAGPYGTADTPRDRMRAAGCAAEAEFNATPTFWRLTGAFFHFLAALVVCLALLALAGSLILAQLGLAYFAAATPLAVAFGVLPGAGRGALWTWATGVMQAAAAVVANVVFVALFSLAVRALLAHDDGMPLLARFLLLDALAVAGLLKRGKIVRFGRRAAQRAGRRLEHARVGGRSGSTLFGSTAAGALAGVGAAELWREYRHGMYRAHLASAALGRGPRRGRRHPAGGRPRSGPVGAPGPAGAAAPARVAARLKRSRSGRAVLYTTQFAGQAAKVAAQGTIGAPVYLPRAAKATAAASRASAAGMRARVADARHAAHTRRGQATAFAAAFAAEYARNVTAPARAAARAAAPGASAAAATAALLTPPLAPSSTPGAARARPVAIPTAPAVPGAAPAPPAARRGPPESAQAVQRRRAGPGAVGPLPVPPGGAGTTPRPAPRPTAAAKLTDPAPPRNARGTDANPPRRGGSSPRR